MRDDIVEVCNRYLGFFNPLQPSLWVTYILKLASVFDNGADNISLKCIPNAENDARFVGLWSRGRQIYKIRNKLLAHRDAAVVAQGTIVEDGLTHEAIKQVLDDACDFFDSAAEKLRVEPVWPMDGDTDLLRMIADLRSL